jgi:hypothetical protein
MHAGASEVVGESTVLKPLVPGPTADIQKARYVTRLSYLGK